MEGSFIFLVFRFKLCLFYSIHFLAFMLFRVKKVRIKLEHISYYLCIFLKNKQKQHTNNTSMIKEPTVNKAMLFPAFTAPLFSFQPAHL